MKTHWVADIFPLIEESPFDALKVACGVRLPDSPLYREAEQLFDCGHRVVQFVLSNTQKIGSQTLPSLLASDPKASIVGA